MIWEIFFILVIDLFSPFKKMYFSSLFHRKTNGFQTISDMIVSQRFSNVNIKSKNVSNFAAFSANL